MNSRNGDTEPIRESPEAARSPHSNGDVQTSDDGPAEMPEDLTVVANGDTQTDLPDEGPKDKPQ